MTSPSRSPLLSSGQSPTLGVETRPASAWFTESAQDQVAWSISPLPQAFDLQPGRAFQPIEENDPCAMTPREKAPIPVPHAEEALS